MASQKQAETPQPYPAGVSHSTSTPQAEPSPAHDESPALQTVRFEVHLTDQQLQDLLQWLVRSLHPVMTLREAAHYLRLRPTEVQALAERGEIPAFKMDNRWRFLKNALDEWLLAQRACEGTDEEGDNHAA